MIFNNDDDAEAAAASVVTLVSHLTWSRYFGQHDCQASTPEKQNAVENVSNQISIFHFKKLTIIFLKKWPIPASFCLFSSFSHYNFNNTN